MYTKGSRRIEEYVFAGQADKPDPLTFRFRRPNAEIMARFRDAVVVTESGVNGTGFVAGTRYALSQAKLGLVQDVLLGWSGYVDAEGKPVPFGKGEVRDLDDEIVQEFLRHLDALVTIGKEEEGKSAPPSGAGSPAGRTPDPSSLGAAVS